jgi:membrane fusion protein (multidrug efflux system)
LSDSEGYIALGEAEVEAAEKKRRTSWLSRFRWPLMIAGPVLIVAIAAFFILTGGRSQATDDAYVQVAKAPVAASVSGRVVEVLVKENQRVKRGDPLFRLDPRDFQVAVDASAARLHQAYGQALALKATYAQAQARVTQARSGVAHAEEAVDFATKEAARQKAMFDAGVASRDQYDQATHAAAAARSDLARAQADVVAAQAEQTAALANAGNAPGASVENHPLVRAARAEVERTTLAQSYGVVVAPTDGVVTRVDQLQPGAYVNAAQTVFWLITGQPWVEANFKEDQLAKMKVGQPAQIEVDAYPDAKLAGHVESFSPGTGQVFSALPAQNATGNWVKVTQRLPVRVAFDRPPPEMAGRGGLSAKVTVDVTGPGKAQPQQAQR